MSYNLHSTILPQPRASPAIWAGSAIVAIALVLAWSYWPDGDAPAVQAPAISTAAWTTTVIHSGVASMSKHGQPDVRVDYGLKPDGR